MKDTVTYPLSAILDEGEESRIEQLERELAEAIAKERERCALVVERVSIPYENTSSEAAEAIRKGE
ncbi:hypothetical protein UFOVP1174_38 [uncultured Caudovirales phage]|uniref:Uncharacterized protein n=1 Tax=uncultured Caudovirales phage TaxID=2100421 RepID=A0A6J5QUX6_9CAUD|nr:hypothetical protein UFOVP1174_38 [uncultured Caudovirales phage]